MFVCFFQTKLDMKQILYKSKTKVWDCMRAVKRNLYSFHSVEPCVGIMRLCFASAAGGSVLVSGTVTH